MAGINIFKSDVDFARNFLVQYLTDAGYEGSLDDGTALNDLLIKAFSLLFTLFRFESDKASAYMSIARAKQLKNLLGTEYDGAIDALLSNWFVSRLNGTTTTGSVRLVFMQAPAFLALTAGSLICTVNGADFTPQQNYVFQATDFTAIANSSQNTVEFYVDVNVQSTSNLNVVVLTGDSPVAYVSDIYFLRMDIVQPFVGGSYKESSDDYIARTQKAVTTRELITDRAINTVIRAEYTDVLSMFVARFGSVEQLRDTVVYDNITVHTGNKADIYTRAACTKLTYVAPVLSGGILDLAGIPNHVVDVLGVSSIPVEPEDPITQYSFTLSGVSETEFGVVGKTPTVTAVATSPGTPVLLTYLTHTVFSRVRDLVYADNQRVACYDPVVKSMFPVLVNLSFAITLSSGTFEDVSAAVKSTITDYFAAIPTGYPFVTSEVISAIHSAVPSVATIQLPMTVTYQYRNPATRTYVAGAIVDQFRFPLDQGSYQVSWNTIQFYTDNDFITITQG